LQLSEIITLGKKALKQLTKTDVITLFLTLRDVLLSDIKAKEEEIKRLTEKVKNLEKTIETTKQKEVNKTSNQPSSKKPEWDKDGNPKKTPKNKRKSGKKRNKRKGSGNKKKDDLIPDTTNHIYLEVCPICGKDLRDQPVTEETNRIVEDIIDTPTETVITEEVQERKWCSYCEKLVSSKTERALPGCDIGLNTTIITAYFWVVNALSLPNIRRFLNSFMKLIISTSGISKMLIRLSKILLPLYDEILENIKVGCKIWADETGWRIKGKLWWLWIFANKYSAYYWPDKSRGSPVVEKILGKIFLGVLITDAWCAYKSIVCAKQTCMAHIFRKIRKFIEAFPQYRSVMKFYLKLRRIIRDGIKLQELRPQVDDSVYQRRLKRLKRRLSELLNWRNPNPILKKIIDKVKRQQEYILTFVEYDDTPYHNNYGEYIIRKGVLKRKISGGSMSCEGARAYAIIQSIAQTCQLRGISFMSFLRTTLIHYIRHGRPMLLSEYEKEYKQKERAAA
jgi:transposase